MSCFLSGGIYEYTLENASKTDTPSLERRANKLAAAVAARAEEIRRGSHGMDFSPPPGKECSLSHCFIKAHIGTVFPSFQAFALMQALSAMLGVVVVG